MRRSILVLVLSSLFVSSAASAEQPLLLGENRGRIKTNAIGMGVLGGWAITNIGVGLGGWATAEQAWLKNFHLMNAGWNVVNLGIAGFGLGSALLEDPAEHDTWETIRRAQSIQKALLFNAGLDFAYIAGGAYLTVRGDRDADDRLVGFGRSIMLQGAFLLAFDAVLYIAHEIRFERFFRQLSD